MAFMRDDGRFLPDGADNDKAECVVTNVAGEIRCDKVVDVLEIFFADYDQLALWISSDSHVL